MTTTSSPNFRLICWAAVAAVFLFSIILTGSVTAQNTTTSLTISAGWNMLSPDNLVVNYAQARSSNTACDLWENPFWWNGTTYETPATLEPLKGYWIWAGNDCTLQLSGTVGSHTLQLADNSWNMISANEARSFTTMAPNCNPFESVFGWNPSANNYDFVSVDSNLDSARGYWAWMYEGCAIAVTAQGDLDPSPQLDPDPTPDPDPQPDPDPPQQSGIPPALPPLSIAERCTASQGSAVNVCGNPHVRFPDAEGGAEICRVPQTTVCVQDNFGEWRWQCAHQDFPLPAGTQANAMSCTSSGWVENAQFSSLPEVDLCKLVTGNIGGVLGQIGTNLLMDEKVLAQLLGTEVAKKAAAVAAFIAFLESEGVSLSDIRSGNFDYHAMLAAFRKTGQKELANLAAPVVKKVLTDVISQRADPATAAEIGAFAEFAIQRLGSLDNVAQADPTVLKDIAVDYAKQKNSPIIEKLTQLQDYIGVAEVYLQTYGSMADFADSALILDTIITFDGRTLRQVLEEDAAVLQSDITRISQQNNARQVDISKFKAFAVTIAAVNIGIEPGHAARAGSFVTWLLEDNHISTVAELETVSPTQVSNWVSQFNQDTESSLSASSSELTETLHTLGEEIPQMAPVEVGYIAQVQGFIAYVANNKNITVADIKARGSKILAQDLTEYINSPRGRQEILTFAIQHTMQPMLQELRNLGIPPLALAEVGRFGNYLAQQRNIDLHAIVGYGEDRVLDLIADFILEHARDVIDIPKPVFTALAAVITQQELRSKLLSGDFRGLAESLVDINISGQFSCPLDAASFVCNIANPASWKPGKIGSIQAADTTGPMISIDVATAMEEQPRFKVCSVPDISIQLAGTSIFAGAALKLGPVSYEDAGLWLDMPTSCSAVVHEHMTFQIFSCALGGLFGSGCLIDGPAQTQTVSSIKIPVIEGVTDSTNYLFKHGGNYRVDLTCIAAVNPLAAPSHYTTSQQVVVSDDGYVVQEFIQENSDQIVGRKAREATFTVPSGSVLGWQYTNIREISATPSGLAVWQNGNVLKLLKGVVPVTLGSNTAGQLNSAGTGPFGSFLGHGAGIVSGLGGQSVTARHWVSGYGHMRFMMQP